MRNQTGSMNNAAVGVVNIGVADQKARFLAFVTLAEIGFTVGVQFSKGAPAGNPKFK